MKVTVRTKELVKEREGLYLDIYNPEGSPKRKKENLNLFIYKKPKSLIEKTHNKETLQLAEAIKGQRQIDLQNGKSGFSNKRHLKENFIEYFEKLTNERRNSTGNHANWDSTLKHLKKYFGNHLTFNSVNEDELENFKKYLLTQVSVNSAASYFAKVKAAINQAFNEKMFNENPGLRVKGITAQLPKREFLTQEEIRSLFDTECDPPLLKQAFLFSVFTGLRWSDVSKLKWKEIHFDKSIGHYIRYQQKKTKKHESLPINQTAITLLGNKKNLDDRIFEDLKYSAWTNIKLQKWVMKAGIAKDITFHCARHSYATLLLTSDVDIFTVSKLLGHSELKTTQIYTRVLDTKKITAVGKLQQLNFLNNDKYNG